MLLFKQKNKLAVVFVLLLVFELFIYGVQDTKAATFVESFSTTTYRDAALTTAEWDLESTVGQLTNGDWMRADETKVPNKFEELVTTVGAPRQYTVHDVYDNPIVLITEAVGGDDIYGIRWMENLIGVCAVGNACWTNLEGTVENAETAYVFPGGGIIKQRMAVLRLPNGFPAVAFIHVAGGSAYTLYYMQWTPNAGASVCGGGKTACWTNASGTTAGAELISNSSNNMKYNEGMQNFDFELDGNGRPLLFYNEHDGSNLMYYFTRWNGSNWTYADGTTVGKEQITTKVSADDADIEFIYNGNEIYFNLRYDDYSYIGKWDGSDWVDLAGSPIGVYTDLTLFRASIEIHAGPMQKRSYLKLDKNGNLIAAVSSTGSDGVDAAETFIARWDSVGDTWREMDGTDIGTGKAAIDAMTSFFNPDKLCLTYISVDKENNIILLLRSPISAAAEFYFTQWNGTDWVQTDGLTSGYEQATNLTDGEYIHISTWVTEDQHGYPVWAYTERMPMLPLYVSKFNGSDITGLNDYTADRDIVINVGQVSFGAYYNYLYFNPDNNDFYLSTENNNNRHTFSQFFYGKYPLTNRRLQSTTIAVPHDNATQITSAKLTAVDTIPANTTLTYYLSANGGTNWELATNGVTLNFANPGTDLRWRAVFTRTDDDYSAKIDYLYIDVEGKTMSTSGDVNITADVEPTLSLAVVPATCTFGSFDTTKIKTCNYNAIVSTNATNGYIGFVRALDDFKSASDIFSNIADAQVTVGAEEYGIGTSDADTVDITAKIPDCASLNDTTSPVDAVPLTTADQSFAINTSVADAEETTLCHVAAISTETASGVYSQVVVISVVGNF